MQLGHLLRVLKASYRDVEVAVEVVVVDLHDVKLRGCCSTSGRA